MAINEDLINKLSGKQQSQIAAILEDPLIWAETMFPAKMGYDTWKDEKGVEQKRRAVTAGWRTRPWQQAVVEAPGLKKVIRVNRRAGKSLMALMLCLHTAFVKGKGVLVLTPYDRQSGELYKELHTRFLDERKDIFTKKIEGATIIQDTKSPYIVRFANGGFINFITTGTKSGGKADAVRGQGGNVGLLFLDEMDYMGQAELVSIFAIAVQTPSMQILCTSTPTGKREMFYDLCVNQPPGWKAFHYSCWETIPGWDEQQDLEMKSMLGDSGYTHEMLAEFGEESEGVFNKLSLDAAIDRGRSPLEYPYNHLDGSPVTTNHPYYGYAQTLPLDPRRKRIVGVDWDKYGAGTQIVVVETNLNTDKEKDGYGAVEDNFEFIKVVHRREIPISQFTLTQAVKELVSINHIFQPDFYYLDAGYGEFQIETLLTLGMECKDPSDPAYGIHKKIKRINFSTGVETVDVYTKQLIKKPIKPEMVGRLRNKFDSQEMILNPYDSQMMSQLENYRVEKITAAGQPKYVSVNEHIVDALMLSVWGLYTEFGDDPNASALVGFVDAPIGEQYKRKIASVNKELSRLGYNSESSAERDKIKDDINMAKEGYIPHQSFEENKKDAITSQSAFHREQSDALLSRGGRFPNFRRKGF